MSYVEDLIDFVLMHPKEIEKAVSDRRQEMCHGHTGGGCTGHSFISDPTALNALKLMTPVELVYIPTGPIICGKQDTVPVKHPSVWLKVAKEVADYYRENADASAFYKHRYEKMQPWKCTCKELHMTASNYYALHADVLKMAENIAIGYGLLSPYWRMKK